MARIANSLIPRIARRVISQIMLPAYEWHIVGSYRRQTPTSKDVDILIILPDQAEQTLLDIKWRTQPIHVTRGRDRQSIRFTYRDVEYPVDIFLARESERPYALLHHTGSAEFNIRTRAHAKRRGLKLTQHGLFRDGRRITRELASEEDVLRYLGLAPLAPHERE